MTYWAAIVGASLLARLALRWHSGKLDFGDGVALGVLLSVALARRTPLFAALCWWSGGGNTRNQPRSSSSSLYGIDHRILSCIDDSDNSNAQGWMNVGFWRDTTASFPQACRALCDLVAERASLSASDRVLDCGYGLGDQCFYLRKRYGCAIAGLTLSPAQQQVAAARCRQLGLQDSVQLFQGDAVQLSATVAAHPALAGCNKVISIDAAYHFGTRARFFQQVHEYLPAGQQATLCLADVVLPDTRAFRLIARVAGNAMPAGNLYDASTYTRHLEQSGFVNVTVQDISDDVFPGLVHFLTNFALSTTAHGLDKWKWRTAGWMWYALWRLGARVVIVKAVKS